MACYLPDHLVRCLICKELFSDARRLRCGCVYCYSCCLQRIQDYTLHCQCSCIHRFKSLDDIEKALVIDNVVNDLVRQYIKQKQIPSKKLVDYDSASVSSSRTEDDANSNSQRTSLSLSLSSPSSRSTVVQKQAIVLQPSCAICKKKSNMIVMCEHCKSDICELCMEKHYETITDKLDDQWQQCKEKFSQINEHVSLSQQNKATVASKLETIRKTIEERSNILKASIEAHRQALAKRIDNHIQNLESIIKNNDANKNYRAMKERLSRILDDETNIANLLSSLDETEKLLQQITNNNKKLKEVETKMPYLSQTDVTSLDPSHFIGELKFDDHYKRAPSTTDNNQNAQANTDVNGSNIPSSLPVPLERTRFPRRGRSAGRLRGGRGMPSSARFNGSYPRSSRINSRYRPNGRASAHLNASLHPTDDDTVDIVPNNTYQWSIDFKEVPYFLAVLDNRNRARLPDTRPHHRHDYMLFIADDFGQMCVYSLPKSMSNIEPSIIGTGELFPKSSRLLIEAFTVYELAIVVYVRRFQQRLNEIEQLKLRKAGLSNIPGEQGRSNDHGGMIYLFSHGGDEIDSVYKPHPIRAILADEIYGRLWALNPVDNHAYCYMMPNKKQDIQKYFNDEEILLDFSNEKFEPSSMVQSNKTIGFIDAEHDSFRLYDKTNDLRLIMTYENFNNPRWKLTDAVIFQDNRTLLKLSEDKSHDRNKTKDLNYSSGNCQRYLVELTPSGEEKRRIEANTLCSMVLGPNDELIMGFVVRGDRGMIHCY